MSDENAMPPPPSPKVAKSRSKLNNKATETSSSTKLSPPKPIKVKGTKTSAGGGLLGSDLALVPQKLGAGRKYSAENGLSPMAWGRKLSQEIPIHRPATRLVSPEELARHNTKSDCWLALRGHVYDVTEYIPYHPGGAGQIMLGAGMDATALFNSIHRYVNFEMMLIGKQVGVYSRRISLLNENEEIKAETYNSRSMVHRDSIGNENSGRSVKTCLGCKICDICKGSDAPGMVPLTSFKETDDFVTFKVSLQGFKYNKDYWSIAILDKEKFLLKVVTKPPDMWIAYFKLVEKIADDTIKLDFTNRYKSMIVKIPKPVKKKWSKIGDPLPDHNEIGDSRNAIEDMVPASVILREQIAHNTYFITVRVHNSGRIGAPLGFDVKIRIDDKARRYTPVCPIFHKKWDIEDPDHQILHFIYKLYNDGTLTPMLTKLPVTSKEDTMLIGASSGNFDTDWFQGTDGLIFLAAGSGITPYFRIIHFLKEHNIALGISHVILIYWNKIESEIVWKNEFEELEETKSWFHFIPVLTRADTLWSGLRGRITKELLMSCINLIPDLSPDCRRVRWMSCGTDGFNKSALEAIEGVGHSITDNVFVFLG